MDAGQGQRAASNTERVDLAPEPVYATAPGCRPTRSTRSTVADDEKIALLADWSERLLARAGGRPRRRVAVCAVKENKFYADSAGTVTTQQRVRLHPELNAVAVDADAGAFETMRTLAPPVGRGWEYLTGDRLGLGRRAGELPELLAEKLRAPRRSSRAATTW